ncbi:MAG: peptidoglycan-binding protein [Patescibacteria group bacterium]|nr:peptidoglycan-binding protein [Patescibacteria group bacterium]
MRRISLIILGSLILFPNLIFAQSYNFERDLYYGLTNDPDVKALQEVLDKEGCFDWPEYTGNFYSITLAGVKCFQEKYGISATGYVGPSTRAKLNELYGQKKEVTKEAVPEVAVPQVQPSSLNQTVTGDLVVTGNIKASRLYQEDHDLVINTLGSGNIILSAAKGFHLLGNQIIMDSTNNLNPLIYISDPLKIDGSITQTGSGQVSFSGNVDAQSGLDVTGGDFTVGGTKFVVGVNTGNITTAGNLSVSGDLTISGNKILSGNETITGSLTVKATTTLGDASTDNIVFTAGAGSNLDMKNYLLLNIGAAGTDFTSGGGLTLADDLTVNGGNLNFGADTTIGDGGDLIILSLKDNVTAALDIKEGTNSYLTVVTTDGGEKITLAKNVDATAGLDVTGASLTVGGSNFTVDTSGNVSVSGTTNLATTTISGAGTYLDVQSEIKNTAGDLSINDNVVVSGTSDLQGNVFDSGGNLTFADATDITGTLTATTTQITVNTGSTALTVRQDGTGNIFEAKDGATTIFTIADGGNVTVSKDLTVSGLTSLATTTISGAGTYLDVQSEIKNTAGDLSINDNLIVSATTSTFKLRVGDGTTISKVLFGTCSVDPPAIAADYGKGYGNCAASGVLTTDKNVIVTPPYDFASGSATRWLIFNGANASSTADGYINIGLVNASTTAAIDGGAETWSWMVIR